MKTTEQINQIVTLKSFIAEVVKSHKETKKIARMSSNAEGYSVWQTASAQSKYPQESQRLFVLYTAYYVLRHSIENVEEYTAKVFNELREEKRTNWFEAETFGIKNYSRCRYTDSKEKGFYEVIRVTIENLAKYVESKEQPTE